MNIRKIYNWLPDGVGTMTAVVIVEAALFVLLVMSTVTLMVG